MPAADYEAVHARLRETGVAALWERLKARLAGWWIAGRLGEVPAAVVALSLAAGLLVLWALVPTLWMTYVVWAALGLCMAAILYEPVFAIVGRAFDDPQGRLRAIATGTVTGGLASTAFLPGTSALVTQLGWQGAVIALAAIAFLLTAAGELIGRYLFYVAVVPMSAARSFFAGHA